MIIIESREDTFDVVRSKIEALKGSYLVDIDTITKVQLKGGKKNPMQGKVTKLVAGSKVVLCSNVKNAYESMVKSRMEKEGKDPEEFVLKPRPWGSRIEDTPFVEHKGNFYIECFFKESGASTYFLDGEPIEKDDIEGLEPPKSSEESQGGISDKVIIRTYAMESIERMVVLSEIQNIE
jgi:hypothetical protein